MWKQWYFQCCQLFWCPPTQHLACWDLSRLSKYSESRRQQVFSLAALSSHPVNWSNINAACHLQLSHLTESLSAYCATSSQMPNGTGQSTNSTAIKKLVAFFFLVFFVAYLQDLQFTVAMSSWFCNSLLKNDSGYFYHTHCKGQYSSGVKMLQLISCKLWSAFRQSSVQTSSFV